MGTNPEQHFSTLPEPRGILKPGLLHLLFPKIPELLENADALPGRDAQILFIFRVQRHSLMAQDYRLAEATQHQHKEALPLRLIEQKDTFPACKDRPAHLDGVGVLDHHVHDGDGQLVNKVAAVRVPKVKDAGDLVIVVLVKLHQHVEVIEVTVIYACGANGEQTKAINTSAFRYIIHPQTMACALPLSHSDPGSVSCKTASNSIMCFMFPYCLIHLQCAWTLGCNRLRLSD